MSENATLKTKAETRARILVVAGQLFERYGPIKTTVADIAREAKMSPANIYNFFKSRDEIVEEVGEINIGELKRKLTDDLRKAKRSWDGIELLFLSTAAHALRKLQNEKDILHLLMLEKQNGWQCIRSFHQFLRQKLEELVRVGVISGEFGEIDPHEAATALFDCMVTATDPWLILQLDPAAHKKRLTMQLRFLKRAMQ